MSIDEKIKELASQKNVSIRQVEEKLGFAKAWVTTVGNPITLSTLWITPLLALMSVFVTVEIPLILTPESVLMYILKFFAEEAFPFAKVET